MESARKHVPAPPPAHTSPAHTPKPALDEAVRAPAAGRKRKPFLVLGGIAAAVVLGLGAYSWITSGKESTDDAQVEADVVPIASRVPGMVKRIPVAENQRVKKGDLLVELDDADILAREQQAEAELETAQAQAAAADAQAAVAAAGARGGFSTAQAQVTGSSAGMSTARAQVEAARAGLQRAEADARKAALDLQRDQKLLAASVIPQARLDDSQAENDVKQAALSQARANLTAAEEALRAAESRVGEARGRFEQSAQVKPQIAAAEAQARLAHAREKSAEAALRLALHQGQLVQAGQPIAALVPERTYVVANFKETQIGRMRAGEAVEVKIDAFPGRTLHGQVESLSGGTGARFSLLPPDNASGNFVKVVQRIPVRIAWVDPPADLPLRAGLSADVTVRVK
jgi:membrane fusion protein (multidrug efflux system)